MNNEYPDPTTEDLKRPDFKAVWQAIKDWDISRNGSAGPGPTLYSGPTGNDVMHILNALEAVQQKAARD